MLRGQNLPVQKHFNEIGQRRVACTQGLTICIEAFNHHVHEILNVLISQLLGRLARVITLAERIPNKIQI